MKSLNPYSNDAKRVLTFGIKMMIQQNIRQDIKYFFRVLLSGSIKCVLLQKKMFFISLTRS